jgi:predicted nucleic acid-binding protein
MTEVFKAKCEGKAKPLSEDGEDTIDSFFESDRILPAPVDRRTAVLARKLMRKHECCKKPADAIHLATAVLMNADEMHTYDGSDLLVLESNSTELNRRGFTRG